MINPLTLPQTLSDTISTPVNYTLINGQGHDCRLVMLEAANLLLSAFTGRSQHQMIIKVFSSLGFELFLQEVKSGETISIPTKDYPQGAYFIRAEEKADDYTIDVLPANVQGFVIKR